MTDDEPHTPRQGAPRDRDVTPRYQVAPEQLSRREVERIERLLGRPPANVDLALAERYRREGVDPMTIVAQIAMELHDVKRPVRLATKAAYWVASGVVGAIIFVAILVSNRSERDTAVEYRLRSCEALAERIKVLEGEQRAGYPMVSTPPPATLRPATSKEPAP